MSSIIYIDRVTKEKKNESVYGEKALRYLYGTSFSSRIFGSALLALFVKRKWFSWLYGWWQRRSWTKRKIIPFIAKYDIDAREFAKPVDAFTSFDDFFTRELHADARPILPGKNIAVIPADGRYLFYQRIDQAEGFVVKGQPFNLETLLMDRKLAKKYHQGSMVIARLCPTDYHRFHFPVDCHAGIPRLINGGRLSVNPIALIQNSQILVENKRVVTPLQTGQFGLIQFIEIGATNVASIIQTSVSDQDYLKGDEKGYFSFGASSLILLFPPLSIQFDQDLVEATKAGFEVRCLLGQSMGVSAVTR